MPGGNSSTQGPAGGRDARLAEAMVALQALTERLRRECPWDRVQTAATIVPHTVEEAYEVADAVAAGDDGKLADELGDLLFQSFFLALLLEERGAGDLAGVAVAVHDKLVRRHPHVFEGDEIATAAGVRSRWEAIKSELEGRQGIFHDVPETLPALLLAKKAQRRAASVGFEFPSLADVVADVEEELEELCELLPAADPRAEMPPDPRHAEELGDLLFAVVGLGRRLNVDPELALRAAVDRFRARIERGSELARGDGHEFAELPLAEQGRYFDRAKSEAKLAGGRGTMTETREEQP